MWPVEVRRAADPSDPPPVGGAFIPDSGCSSVILVDQAAESIDADDCALTPIPGGGSRHRRLEREAAVRSFFVVVPPVLFEDPEGYQNPDSPSDQRFSRMQRCSSQSSIWCCAPSFA